jgi:hypothetical protein
MKARFVAGLVIGAIVAVVLSGCATVPRGHIPIVEHQLDGQELIREYIKVRGYGYGRPIPRDVFDTIGFYDIRDGVCHVYLYRGHPSIAFIRDHERRHCREGAFHKDDQHAYLPSKAR